MNRINPIDFGELLEEMGYVVQDDTGEVYTPADNQPFWEAQRFLLDLAIRGHLIVDRDHLEKEMTYFIPHWKCFNSLQDYCEAFPDNQECLMYDV